MRGQAFPRLGSSEGFRQFSVDRKHKKIAAKKAKDERLQKVADTAKTLGDNFKKVADVMQKVAEAKKAPIEKQSLEALEQVVEQKKNREVAK